MMLAMIAPAPTSFKKELVEGDFGMPPQFVTNLLRSRNR